MTHPLLHRINRRVFLAWTGLVSGGAYLLLAPHADAHHKPGHGTTTTTTTLPPSGDLYGDLYQDGY